jgi:hypothetical protein
VVVLNAEIRSNSALREVEMPRPDKIVIDDIIVSKLEGT